jgi:hypothetical protein
MKIGSVYAGLATSIEIAEKVAVKGLRLAKVSDIKMKSAGSVAVARNNRRFLSPSAISGV